MVEPAISNDQFPQIIAARMKALGYDQKTVAAECRLDGGPFSRWLRGLPDGYLSPQKIHVLVEFLRGRIMPAEIVWDGEREKN